MDSTRMTVMMLGAFVVVGTFVYVNSMGIVGEGSTVHISRACMSGKHKGGSWRSVMPLEAPPKLGQRVIVEVPGQIDRLEGRVLGIPGDTITVTIHQVLRNGEATDRTPTPHSHPAYPSWIEHTGTARHKVSYAAQFPLTQHHVTVPPGRVFVMGDQRWGKERCTEGLGLVETALVAGLSPWPD